MLDIKQYFSDIEHDCFVTVCGLSYTFNKTCFVVFLFVLVSINTGIMDLFLLIFVL